MKKFILPLALILAGCAKQYEPNPVCQRVYLLSDRYSLDTLYLRSDTLWPFGRWHNEFCGSDTLQFMEEDNTMLLLCADSTYELTRWVIGNKITQPKLFK